MSAQIRPPRGPRLPACRQTPDQDDDWEFREPDLDRDELWDPFDPDEDEPQPERDDFWHDPDLDADD